MGILTLMVYRLYKNHVENTYKKVKARILV